MESTGYAKRDASEGRARLEGVIIVFIDNISVFVPLLVEQKKFLIFIRNNPLPSLRKMTQTSSSWFIPLQTLANPIIAL